MTADALATDERQHTESEATPARPDADERAANGRAARSRAPRSSHRALEPPAQRDALGLLEAQAADRLPDLVPIRYGRMLASPFAFYRGAAAVMAGDLASGPRSGLTVQLCGDAHLANFGAFASPERSLVFDLNDFDETLPGPFEWDVKRLAASFEVAGRDRDVSAAARRGAVLTAVRAYRETMRELASRRNLDVWYASDDVAALQARLRREGARRQAKVVARLSSKARARDSVRAFSRLAEASDGSVRIRSAPPLVEPLRDVLPDAEERGRMQDELLDLLRAYRGTLQPDRRRLLDAFEYADSARKVVGVGSVGTRCWIVLLLGRDQGDPLFLQVKEAGPSVLEGPLARSAVRNQGRRVVEGQRAMQAVSDILLGWVHVEHGLDGRARDFYVRQLWDWKVSVDVETVTPQGLEIYARACGMTLARAHARSGDRIAIASYLGRRDVFDRAVADFATAYADLNERDHRSLAEAVRAGRVIASEGA